MNPEKLQWVHQVQERRSISHEFLCGWIVASGGSGSVWRLDLVFDGERQIVLSAENRIWTLALFEWFFGLQGRWTGASRWMRIPSVVIHWSMDWVAAEEIKARICIVRHRMGFSREEVIA